MEGSAGQRPWVCQTGCDPEDEGGPSARSVVVGMETAENWWKRDLQLIDP